MFVKLLPEAERKPAMIGAHVGFVKTWFIYLMKNEAYYIMLKGKIRSNIYSKWVNDKMHTKSP